MMIITNEYDNITSGNYTDILNDYDNITLSNCTNNENIFDINIPTLFTISCLSFLCLLSLMVYTSIKLLINDGEIFIPKSSCSLYHNRTE